jgi:23S rRNA (uracil1939-C5)-methyltransferase
VAGFELRPIQNSPSEFEYRNRAQIKTDGLVAGFLQKGTHKIVDIKNCLVLNKATQAQYQKIRESLPEKEWNPKPPYKFRFIDIDDESVDIQLDKRLPFKQGNTEQNIYMRQLVSEWVKTRLQSDSSQNKALEMFCGSGNFTEVLSQSGVFESVLAYEVSEAAVEKLKSKNLKNVQVMAADLFSTKSLEKKSASKLNECGFMLVDPPREGWPEMASFVENLTNLKNILYISCDPVTLFRDLRNLMNCGYWVEVVQPVDLFPQTPHIEVMTWLTKAT